MRNDLRYIYMKETFLIDDAFGGGGGGGVFILMWTKRGGSDDKIQERFV